MTRAEEERDLAAQLKLSNQRG